ncbi:hypothetical protein HDU76_000781 [Blyttiomyces sp. JEL0837]|nr:hypothetical protein HDU76_000781 [Blyttiomyces sp. JEL0837]
MAITAFLALAPSFALAGGMWGATDPNSFDHVGGLVLGGIWGHDLAGHYDLIRRDNINWPDCVHWAQTYGNQIHSVTYNTANNKCYLKQLPYNSEILSIYGGAHQYQMYNTYVDSSDYHLQDFHGLGWSQDQCEQACANDPQCFAAEYDVRSGDCETRQLLKVADSIFFTLPWWNTFPQPYQGGGGTPPPPPPPSGGCSDPKFYLDSPVWGSTSVRVNNPDWHNILMSALKNADYTIGISEDVTPAGQQAGQSIKIALGGTGYEPSFCTSATNLITGMLMTNLKQVAKQMADTTPSSIDCPCLGPNCPHGGARRDGGVADDLANVFDNSTTNVHLERRCKQTPCGCINPQCTCFPSTSIPYWLIPTFGSVKIGATTGGTQQLSLNYQLTVTQSQCTNTQTPWQIFGFIFNIASAVIPFIGLAKDVADAASNSVKLATAAVGGVTTFSTLGCGASHRRDGNILGQIIPLDAMPQSPIDIANANSTCTYDSVDVTLNKGTSFLDVISYLVYNTPTMAYRPIGCYCYSDSVTTMCVNSKTLVDYYFTKDYVKAIGNDSVVEKLSSHFWKSNETSFSTSFETDEFQVSVFPGAAALQR